MAIKGKSITINLYAFNNTDNVPASGLADISGYIIKDGAAPAVLTNAISEPSSFNMPGLYEVALTAAEMDANSVTVHGTSFSNPSGIVIYPWMTITEQNYLPTISGTTNTLPTINTIIASGDVAGWGAVNTLTAEQIAGEVTLSGNAANWSGVADVSNLALESTVNALNDPTAVEIAAEVTLSGNAAGWNTSVSSADILNIVSGVWNEVIDGTLTTASGLLRVVAYCSNNVGRAGSVYTYYNEDGSAILFTATGTDTTRTRS